MALPKERRGISLTGFLRATLVGGLLFLLPVVLIVIVLSHAMQLAVKVAKPISSLLPVEAVIGIRGETCLAVLLLILLSLGAGLVAQTKAGKRILSWSENSFLGGLPQYQVMKSWPRAFRMSKALKTCVLPSSVSRTAGRWDTCSNRLRRAGLPYFCRRRLPLCLAT